MRLVASAALLALLFGCISRPSLAPPTTVVSGPIVPNPPVVRHPAPPRDEIDITGRLDEIEADIKHLRARLGDQNNP